MRTSCLHPPANIPGTHFCSRLSRLQEHSTAGRIMSMKNFNDLPACGAVPQPNEPPRAPSSYKSGAQLERSNITSEVSTLLYFHFQIFRTKLMFIFQNFICPYPNNEYLESSCYMKLLTGFESLNNPVGFVVLFLKHAVHKPTVSHKILK